jgi:hypothetical protein
MTVKVSSFEVSSQDNGIFEYRWMKLKKQKTLALRKSFCIINMKDELVEY